MPRVLGAATVVALYFLARRHFDLPTAVLAGAVLSLLSAHFWYSQVGFIDHHAAVALVSTWVLAAGMALRSHGQRESRAWHAGIGAGIAIGLSLLVWPGCLLHVSLVESGWIAALLTRRDGAEVPPTGDGPGAAALARHRLIYESEGIGKRDPPSYKVYEFVPGARIVGAAPAGARVRLKLPLRSNRGRSLVHTASSVADAGGRYLLRVPYANVGGPPAVEIAADYALECGDEVMRVSVRETDVRAGAEVRGPWLCGSSAPRAESAVHEAAGAQPGLL